MPSALEEILRERYSRRRSLKDLTALTAGLSLSASVVVNSARAKSSPALSFRDVPYVYDERDHVAEGYDARVLIAWGDAVTGKGSAFTPDYPSAKQQAESFGTNNDFIAFLPLPRGSQNSDHGLLFVNHEYPLPHLMFPGYTSRNDAAEKMTPAELEIEQMTVGLSVVEIKKHGNEWRVVPDSKYARRFTPQTEFEITGPAASHQRLKTSADPAGTNVFGTLGNCAGGMTPWGTVLSGEENIQEYFWGDQTAAGEKNPRELKSWQSFSVGQKSGKRKELSDGEPRERPLAGWYRIDDRFNIEKEPHEPNRFGWVVEVDPYDPTSTPKKRTALGRFRHESATVVVKPKTKVVVYSGDDQEYQCIYKFVSRDVCDQNVTSRRNANLLEAGDLYAAQFNADGTGRWIKLTGKGEVDPGSVLIDVRQHAAAAGATSMDRPEDIEVSSLTDRVYLSLTKNPIRVPELVNGPNPEAKNYWGQLLEITPPGTDGARDHTAETFEWRMVVLCHDLIAALPERTDATTPQYWFTNPDNLVFDKYGRLWVATDGIPDAMEKLKRPAVHDGLWVMDLTAEKPMPKHFYGVPCGAELTGPCFTPDGKTLFVSVQHPAHESGSTFSMPTTRWPDFKPNMPPRPAIVAITKKDGGEIGE
jgi:hypothetical protein